MKNDIAAFARELAEGQVEVASAAFDAGRRAERAAIDAIIRAYDEVREDPKARIPQVLALAIYNARTQEQKDAMFADAGMQRDRELRYEGRPEHDQDVVGRILKAGH